MFSLIIIAKNRIRKRERKYYIYCELALRIDAFMVRSLRAWMRSMRRIVAFDPPSQGEYRRYTILSLKRDDRRYDDETIGGCEIDETSRTMPNSGFRTQHRSKEHIIKVEDVCWCIEYNDSSQSVTIANSFPYPYYAFRYIYVICMPTRGVSVCMSTCII